MYIVAIMWGLMSLLIMFEYAPRCKELAPNDQLVVGLIILLGGPIFVASSVLETLLEQIVPPEVTG